MLHNDNEMIFESYFHAITDIIDESRGRKKQFTELLSSLRKQTKAFRKLVL